MTTDSTLPCLICQKLATIPKTHNPVDFFGDWAWVAVEHNTHGRWAPNGHARTKVTRFAQKEHGSFVYYQNKWSNIETKVEESVFESKYRCIPLVDPLDEWTKKS